jgi:glucan phosphoethanolaminetransferase (alkaline phosphatase superfamily)
MISIIADIIHGEIPAKPDGITPETTIIDINRVQSMPELLSNFLVLFLMFAFIFSIHRMLVARKIWQNKVLPDDEKALLPIRTAFIERFSFWPKVIRGGGILFILLAAIDAFSIQQFGVYVWEYRKTDNAMIFARTIRENAHVLFRAFILTSVSFAAYYIFQLILRAITKKRTSKPDD